MEVFYCGKGKEDEKKGLCGTGAVRGLRLLRKGMPHGRHTDNEGHYGGCGFAKDHFHVN